jgi:hypothetical protein
MTPEAKRLLSCRAPRKPAHLGTDLGTKHRETAPNQCDVLQPVGYLNRVDLAF